MRKKKRLIMISAGICCLIMMAALATYMFYGPEIRYQLHKNTYAQLVYIPDEAGNVGVQIQWEGRTYTSYETELDLYSLMGKQFGVLNGDPRAQMHSVKGLDTSEWVLLDMNILMGWAQLYKADDVTEIPDILLENHEGETR